MSSSTNFTVFCPHCGQKLAIPTNDLQQRFQCPRCRAEESAADLIPAQKTLAAVPIESVRPTPSVAGAPALPAPFEIGTPMAASAPYGPSSIDTPPAIVEKRDVVRPRESVFLGPIRAVLGVAERIDAYTYGHRLTVVYVLSGTYCLCLIASALTRAPAWERGALLTFFAVLAIYGLAHIGMFRSDDGRWTLKTALAGLRGSFGRAREWLADWRDLPQDERRASLSSMLVMGGMVTVAVRGGFEWLLAPADSLPFFLWGFAAWAAIAVGLYRWYTYRSLRPRRTRALPAPNALCARAAGLPPVLDLVREREASLRRARLETDDYLYSLLTILADWKPRPRADALEADYHASLHRHLRKRAPDLLVERERPIEAKVEGTRRRLDLAIDGRVVIELKRNLRRTADADRAFGQLRGYAQAWPHGPILLVLCETDDEFAQLRDLRGKIETLRAANCPVVAIAAGRRA